MAACLRTPFFSNKCGSVGLCLSVIGNAAIWLLGFVRFGYAFEVIRDITACCLLGLLVSSVGLVWKPRGKALAGLLLGIIGSLYLPTIFLPVLLRR